MVIMTLVCADVGMVVACISKEYSDVAFVNNNFSVH